MIKSGSIVRHTSGQTFKVVRIFPFLFSSGVEAPVVEVKTIDEVRSAFFTPEDLSELSELSVAPELLKTASAS